MVNTTGIVLAGGKSTRMGRDKTYLTLGGQRVILETIKALRDLFPEILVVTNSPDTLKEYRVPTIADIVPGKGPLGGIHAGLSTIDTEYAFFVACDMPFLNKGFIKYMVGQTPGFDVVVPFFDGMYEPLHAVYSKNCLSSVEKALLKDKPMIIGFYPQVRVRGILSEEIRRYGRESDLFFNINRPIDLLHAQHKIQR
jgi:molybdopterin-guanine dinucleotide biosynthesis protein A